MAVQNAFVNVGKHHRGGISVRIAKGEYDWFGFRMKPGFIFSNNGEYCFVFTGVTSSARDRAGYYKTLRVFVRHAVDPREAIRDFRASDWHVEWLSERDPLAAKMLRKGAEWAKQGWKAPVKSDVEAPSMGRHLFTSKKANCSHGRKPLPWEEDEAPEGYTWGWCDKASPIVRR